MEYLQNVLIKESVPQGEDRVFIVNNLPKNLLYTTRTKMVPRKDKEGYFTGDMAPDPEGTKEEVLVDGVIVSKSDDAILFNMKHRHVAETLANIDRYIDRMFPRDVHPPERVPYAATKGDMRSTTIPKSRIPVVNIPLPDHLAAGSEGASPASNDAPSQPAALDIEAIKAAAVEEYRKQTRREVLAKARAAKAAKKK